MGRRSWTLIAGCCLGVLLLTSFTALPEQLDSLDQASAIETSIAEANEVQVSPSQPVPEQLPKGFQSCDSESPHLVNVVVPFGAAATLPETATVTQPDGSYAQLAVRWAVTGAKVATAPGTHDVLGCIEQTGQPIRGRITVSEPDHTIRVAAVGDSITEATATNDPGSSYPAQLGRMLGADYDVRNFGASGHEVLNESRWSYRANPLYAQSKAFQPDVVLLQLGTNDSRSTVQRFDQSFVADYRELVRSYQQLQSQPVIYVMLPPAVTKGNAFDLSDENVTAVIALILEAMAAPEFADVTIIDNNALFRTVPELLPDGVHPGVAGARLLAEHVREALVGHL